MKKLLKWIIYFEFLTLGIFLLFIRINKNNNFKPVSLSLSDFTSDIATVNDDGSMQVYSDAEPTKKGIVATELDGVDEENSVCFIISNPFLLKKGYYTLHVEYSATENQGIKLTAEDYNHWDYIMADDMILEHSMSKEDYQFSVRSDIEDLQVKALYTNKGFFQIKNIYLISNDNGCKRGFVFLAFAFLALDYLLMLITMNKDKRFLALSIAGITFLSSLPLFYKGFVNAGDLQFHLMRIEGIVHDLKLRIFPTRVSTAWLGGYGYPASIFYGDIFLYFPALLRLFGFTITEAYETFVFFIDFLTSISAVVCFSKIFKSNKVGVLTSLVYVISYYRLTDVYARSAVGEYISFIFYPIIALAMVRIYSKSEKTNKDNLKNGLLLAFGMSGIITSHILSAEMTIFALVLTALIFFKRTFTKNSLLSILYGAIGAFLLSAFFLIPFLDYYKNVPVFITYQIAGTSGGGGNFQHDGASIAQLFGFFDNPFDGYFPLNIGLVLMATIFVGLYIWMKGKATFEIKALTVESIIFILIASDIFPWSLLIKGHNIFYYLSRVQFPWRYLTYATIFSTLLFGFILTINEKENVLSITSRNIKIFTYIFLIISIFYYNSIYEDSTESIKFYDTHSINSSAIYMGEYNRIGTKGDQKGIVAQIDVINGGLYGLDTEDIDEIDREGNNYSFYVKSSDKPATATIPLLNYKGYHAYDEKGNELKIQDGADYAINVVLPKNYDGNIYVDFKDPWYWTLGLWISVVSFFALILYYIFDKKKGQKVLINNVEEKSNSSNNN